MESATAWLPGEEDVAAYERRGWFVTPRILPDDLLDATREAIVEYHAGRRDRPLPQGLAGPDEAGFADWRPGDGDGVRNNEFCSLQNDGVRALALHPAVGAVAARLARAEIVRLFDDQAVYKPPQDAGDATAVGWHTDHSYWSTCTSRRMLTAWIPLQDSDAGSGTLRVIDGSHRWPESEHVRGFNDPDLDRLGERLGREIHPEAVLDLRLKKGQVSFHHMRTLHASAPNRAATPRFALAVHLQDGDNRHRPFVAAGREVVLPHDRLCRRGPGGGPDYTDPAVFPELWAAPGQSDG